MEQSNLARNSYYKDNVFARDEQYYTQNLNSPRKIQGQRRQSSLLKSRSNVGQPSFVNNNPQQSLYNPQHSLYNPQIIRQMESKVQIGYPPQLYNNQYQINKNPYVSRQENTPQFLQAIQQNKALKRKLDEVLNGSNQFGNSSNVVIMQHYSKSHQEASLVKQQQQKILQLEQILKKNEDQITVYKQGADQLQLRMSNIQSIDRELYKTLQGSVNRDRQLLQRASSALARGQKRQDISKILQQIITH